MALEHEFEYYLEHQDRLVSQYQGKYIVIRDRRIVGAYDDEMEAITTSARNFPLGSFLVQKCEAGADNYTQTFHSPMLPC